MTAIATLRLSAIILRNKRFLSNAQRVRSVSYMYAAAAVRRAHPFNVANRRCNKLATSAVSNSGNETLSESIVDPATYERVCTETLESLCDYFEELTERATDVEGSDVAFGDGVLTVNLGREHGIYVINRQSPNKQIWLSSPTSGPKRYDFVSSGDRADGGKWIYKHTGQSLHDLLQQELATIFPKQSVDFCRLPYSS